MNEGIIYVLTNPAMPDMVKIGKTNQDLQERLKQLYSTGVPLPFKCEFAAKVDDIDKWEKILHTCFAPDQVNRGREFFSIDPYRPIVILKEIALEDMTPAVQELADSVDPEAKEAAKKLKRRKRRPNFNFFDMGIPLESRLEYNGKDDHSCIVAGKRHVKYEGEMFTLTSLTTKLLGHEGTLRGPAYWRFNGRNLTDIYEETYGVEEIDEND